MKAVALFLVCVLSAACYCNHNQELVNNIKNMQHDAPNADTLTNNCEFQRYFWTHNTNRNNLNAIGDQTQSITWLRATHKRQFFKALKDLKLGTRAMSLSFENQITDTRSGVIAQALIGYRKGESVVASVGVATSTCDMIPQSNSHTSQYCHAILFWTICDPEVTHTTPRGFDPHELNNVLSKLQSDAIRELYNSVSSRTGLKADNLDNSLQTLYIAESQVLRRFYPEITYDFVELMNVPLNEITSALKEASKGEIRDVFILNRIKQVATSSKSLFFRSSFFFASNSKTLFVISIHKFPTNVKIRMSSFTVNYRFPGRAFATSVGAWNLEREGHPANPSVHEILKIFPPLK